MLNSEEIFPYLKDPLGLAVKQQVGVDLTIEIIKRLKGNHESYLCEYYGDCILKEKTLIRNTNQTYELVPLKQNFKLKIEDKKEERTGWYLLEGVYSLTFNQGCKLPNNISAEIKHRSSLNRLGLKITSGIYDPGFEVEQMGAMLKVDHRIFIEYQSRIAQIIMNYCTPTKNEYNGQFQKEKDIK